MDDLAGAGRDLLVVERDEDVLRVAAVDPVAVAVEHVDVDEVRVGVDGAVRPDAARPADARGRPGWAISSTQISFESTVPWVSGWPTPSVRTTTSTRYFWPGLSVGTSGRSGPRSVPSIAPPSRRAKRSTRTFLSLRNFACASAAASSPSKVGRAGVGAGEEVVVDLPRALAVEVPGAEVVRGQQVHVALGAVRLRHRRVVEAPRPVAGDAREQVGVVVVLPADEILVVVQGEGQADLVAGRAELGALDDRLQERLLVHLGLGLHQRVVDPLEDRVVAEGEGIMLGLLDRVGGVAAGVVDGGDRVADRAGDAGLARRVVHVVVVRVVELAGEERHGVVAAGAPAGGLGRAVALQRDLARLAHAHQVGLVVERAEVVRRVEPAVVGVLVALQAVLVHHQRLGRDELAVGGDGLGREEVLLALLRPLDAERPGVLGVEQPHHRDEADDRDAKRRAHSQRIRGPASRCLT